VIVIDRHPIEFGPQVVFDALHQSPGQRLEVVIFHAVLCADDEAELVAITLRWFEPGITVHRAAVGALELPASTLARRAVALDVAQMRVGNVEPVAAEFDGANLDDHAPLAKGGEAVAR